MEGKRFAFGLVAGILVGIAVVTASGGLSSASGSLPILNPIRPESGQAVTTTARSTNQSSHTNATPVSALLTNATKGYFQTTTPASPSFSSRLTSIAQQPLVSNAVILVPVLLAVLLGAVLYRASVREGENDREE